LINISPHTGIKSLHTVSTGMEQLRTWNHRLGGLKCASVVWAIFLSVLVCAQNFSNRHAWRYILVSFSCIVGIPACFASVGIFQAAYGCLLLLPLSVCLFALLSRNAPGSALQKTIVFLLLLSAVLPGAYLWRFVIQGVPSVLNNPHQRMAEFVKNATHPDDVAYVDSKLWYETKPQIKETMSLFWDTHARTSKDRDKVSVVIILPESHLLEILPGEWRATGEFLEVPNFHRFYRIFQKAPPYRFIVYRRVDR